MSTLRPRTGRHYDSPEQEAYLNLWQTYDELKELEETVFSQHDLSAQQYNALRLLRAASPDAVATLALGAQLISRAPDMTRLLDKLERRGFVQRERRDDNRRVVHVSITQSGLDLLTQLSTPVRDCHQQQLGHLSEKELRQLTRLLTKARSRTPEENLAP